MENFLDTFGDETPVSTPVVVNSPVEQSRPTVESTSSNVHLVAPLPASTPVVVNPPTEPSLPIIASTSSNNVHLVAPPTPSQAVPLPARVKIETLKPEDAPTNVVRAKKRSLSGSLSASTQTDVVTVTDIRDVTITNERPFKHISGSTNNLQTLVYTLWSGAVDNIPQVNVAFVVGKTYKITSYQRIFACICRRVIVAAVETVRTVAHSAIHATCVLEGLNGVPRVNSAVTGGPAAPRAFIAKVVAEKSHYTIKDGAWLMVMMLEKLPTGYRVVEIELKLKRGSLNMRTYKGFDNELPPTSEEGDIFLHLFRTITTQQFILIHSTTIETIATSNNVTLFHLAPVGGDNFHIALSPEIKFPNYDRPIVFSDEETKLVAKLATIPVTFLEGSNLNPCLSRVRRVAAMSCIGLGINNSEICLPNSNIRFSIYKEVIGTTPTPTPAAVKKAADYNEKITQLTAFLSQYDTAVNVVYAVDTNAQQCVTRRNFISCTAFHKEARAVLTYR